MTEGFDFETWLEEARAGLEALQAKREALMREKETIETALEDTDREIVALAAMLEAHSGAAPKLANGAPKSNRKTGIKKAGRKIAEELTCGVEWTGDQLAEMLAKEVPDATPKSYYSALGALAHEGVFIRTGKRGSWVYETTIGKVPGEAVQEPSEGAEEPEAPETTDSSPEPQPTQESGQQALLPEVVVVGVGEVIAAIAKELKKKQHISMGEKNIGWIAADLHCEPKTVRDALKVMVEGDYEFGYEGETKVLRRKAEPGSKEELKRTSIKDRPLFPEADRPPHA